MSINEEFAEVKDIAQEDQEADINPAEGDVILADINRQLKRAKTAKHLDAKVELANNIYPLLKSIVEWIDNGFGEVFEILDEENEENEEEEDIDEEGVLVPWELMDKIIVFLANLTTNEEAQILHKTLFELASDEIVEDVEDTKEEDEIVNE